jgi:glutamate carboxypeptidase
MTLTSVEADIARRIRERQSAMEASLGEMVALPTGRDHAPGLEAMRGLLMRRLAALGAVVEEWPAGVRPDWIATDAPQPVAAPTLVARRTEGRAGPTLLIAGHMDTVHDPHGAFQSLQRSANGRATGPGAADMKGGLEVALTALWAVETFAPSVRWIFIINADEESGSFRSADHLARVAAECDAGFIMEPALADGGLVVERPGSGQFMIEATGRAAHAGRDFASGVSAVTALAEAILQAARLTDLDRGRIVNVGPLRGGDATNIVADRAFAWGNFRCGDEAQGEVLRRQLAALERGAADQLPRIAVRQILNRPPKPCTDAVARLAEAAVRTAGDLGMPLRAGRTGGVSDGNLIQAAGVPCLDGLGVRGGNLHRVDEYVELESLTERAALLAILLLRTAAHHPPITRANRRPGT